MNVKHQEIEISESNPFENCQLKRKVYGEFLTEIVGSYSEGFVLAINNKWGTGKTTFVKMWKQQLINAEFETLYFNAWTNDFDSNPLIAILSELQTISSSKKKDAFKKLLSKGSLITKNVLPGIAKAIAKKYVDVDAIADAIENVTKSAVEILKDDIEEYAKKKQGLLDFKIELEKFVEQNTNGKPLIFIIDELDRCRPTYSVEVLEQVKHFFSVKGIIFVLAIDKIQLGNSIRGFYGSEQIDADEYLRRFIDLEYNLPSPEIEVFCNYLFEYYNFGEFFNHKLRINHRELHEDKALFLTIAILLFEKDGLSLRQQEKIFAHARIALNLFKIENYVYPNIFLLLVYLRNMNDKLYFEIRNRKITPQELINQLRSLFPNNMERYSSNEYTYLEARLATYYNNYYNKPDHSSKLITRDSQANNGYTLMVNSGLGISNNDSFLHALQSLQNTRAGNTSLEYLLNKIDLLQSISEAQL